MLAGDSFERHHLLVLKAQVARALDLLPNVLGNQQLVGGREIRDAERLDHGLAEELIHVADRLAGVEANPLERQGLLERDAENSYLTTDAVSIADTNEFQRYSNLPANCLFSISSYLAGIFGNQLQNTDIRQGGFDVRMIVDEDRRHTRQPRSDDVFFSVVKEQDFVETKSGGSRDRFEGCPIRLAQAHF
jgi:hypothetical protein